MTLRPWYNQDANYQTNAKSFMDYLARTNKFLEVLIEDYDNFQELVLAELERIKFDSEMAVEDILLNWLEDGTLAHIINDGVLGNKADTDWVDNQLDHLRDDIQNDLLDLNNNISDLSLEVNRKFIESLGTMKYMAHRGAVQMAPENSLPAIEKSGDLGYWGVEIDCRLSTEGTWFAFHDDTLERMTNGNGSFLSKTDSQLKALEITSGAGVWAYPNLRIPTLEDCLDVVIEKGLHVCLDLKGTFTSANFQNLIDLLKTKGLIDKVSFSFLDINYIDMVRDLNSTIKIEYATNTVTETIYNKLESVGNCILSIQYSFLTRNIVSECHSRNILVSTYTVNDYNVIETCKRTGVNYLYTDVAIGGI